MQTRFPATVMVLGVLSNNGESCNPHIFKPSLRVNIDMNLDVIANVMKPWMDETADRGSYAWQQVGAPAHSSKGHWTGAGRTCRLSGRG
jgi:hypothetical protein